LGGVGATNDASQYRKIPPDFELRGPIELRQPARILTARASRAPSPNS